MPCNERCGTQTSLQSVTHEEGFDIVRAGVEDVRKVKAQMQDNYGVEPDIVLFAGHAYRLEDIQ